MKFFIHLLFCLISTSPIQDNQNCSTIAECLDLFEPAVNKFKDTYNDYFRVYLTERDISHRSPSFRNAYVRYKFFPTFPHHDPIDLLIYFGYSSDEASQMLKEINMNVDKLVSGLKNDFKVISDPKGFSADEVFNYIISLGP